MNIGESTAESLVRKYATAAPRYTSYPTAVEFSPQFSENQWRTVLSQIDDKSSERGYSLYVHIPFCRSLCLFCACHKKIMKNREGVDRYLEALAREIDEYGAILGNKTVLEQIHWGGGSPNFLLPQEMIELMQAIKRTFPAIAQDAEISVELEPRTTSPEQLSTLQLLGFNRLSFGIQDFDPDVQRLINRQQPVSQTRELIQKARSLKFQSISIDLIYGLPGQTPASFARTIEQVIDISPDRISLFAYAHVTWKNRAQGALAARGLPSPDQRLQLFVRAFAQLEEAGYVYIGMDHFARPSDSLTCAQKDGTLHRNFMGYTTHRGLRLIGIGASSISSFPEAYAQNKCDIDGYTKSIEQHGLAIQRGIERSREDLLRGEIIESIMCSGEVSFSTLFARWGIDFKRHFSEALTQLRPFVEDGLVVQNSFGFSVTQRGKLFLRNIAMLFDQYLPKYDQSQAPVFSQTV